MSTELTGRELDIAIATKVMGWYPVKVDDGAIMWANAPEETATNLDVVEDNDPWWSPSASIAAAMEVAEKMWQQGFRFSLKLYGDDDLKEWSAIFYNADTGQNQFLRLADTPAEAMCKSALAAVDSK
jgi:hypothetical protein